MFKAIKNIVGLISLLSTALVAYRELRKAWLSVKATSPKNGNNRSSEYANYGTSSAGSPYTRYSG